MKRSSTIAIVQSEVDVDTMQQADGRVDPGDDDVEPGHHHRAPPPPPTPSIDAPEEMADDESAPRPLHMLLDPQIDGEKATMKRGPEMILGDDDEEAPVPHHYYHVEDGNDATARPSIEAKSRARLSVKKNSRLTAVSRALTSDMGTPSTLAPPAPPASYSLDDDEEDKPPPSRSTWSVPLPRPSAADAPPDGERAHSAPLVSPPSIPFYAVEATLVDDDPPSPQYSYASYQHQRQSTAPVYDAVRVPEPHEEPWWREEWRRNRTIIVLGVPYVWLALQLGKVGEILWEEVVGWIALLLER